MVKGFRHIRYQEIKPSSHDKKSLGSINSTKPKIIEIKGEESNISPTTGKKRDS